jgi:release factor glutamine methyltransferase
MSNQHTSDSSVDESANAVVDTWTISRVLSTATTWLLARGEGGRLDAELLLSEILGLSRIQLYTNFDKPLTPVERDRYKELLRRRGGGEPVALILGWRDFMRHRFTVTNATLIPRPDTEILVEEAIKLASETPSIRRILDIGTGSGCIAISLATALPEAEISAWDVSPAALAVARENAERICAGRIYFEERDCMTAWSDEFNGWDMIVSNPPYIPEATPLDRSVRDFEPPSALFGGIDGLKFLRHLMVESLRAVRPGGCLLMEIGYDQGPVALELMRENGWEQCRIVKDLARKDRVVVGRRALQG